MTPPVCPGRCTVKRPLTPKRPYRVVENDEYVAFLRRVIRAYSRRVAVGDVEAITAMVASPEYSNSTPSDAGFIQSLYSKLLGRVASPSELAGWLGALPSLGRAGVANMFVHSAEFRADVVQELYGFTYAPAQSVVSLFADLLHRTSGPTAAEINGWVNSGLDIYSIEIAIAGASEFVALASTGIIV